jgi:hypothetical protein
MIPGFEWGRVPLAAVVLVVLAFVAIGVWVVLFGGAQLVSDAGPCREVTSSQCQPFVQAVYAAQGKTRAEVASVRGRPYCGKDACEASFGALLVRLEVTYYDGTKREYSCSQQTDEQPTCAPAAPSS